jgi:hypothetical protein
MIARTVAALRRWFSRPAPTTTIHDVDVDRRLWVRCLTDVETTCRPADDDNTRFSCRVRDISRGGVNLLLRAPLDSGTLLSIDFPEVEDKPAYTVLATILHVTSQPNGEHAAGCAFACELTEADVQGFITQRRPVDAPDKRSFVRFPCATKASFRVVAEKEMPLERARVVDISPVGIGMVLGRPVDVGTLLNLEVPGAHGESPLKIIASVARADAAVAGDWSVGCTFFRELTDKELQTLV